MKKLKEMRPLISPVVRVDIEGFEGCLHLKLEVHFYDYIQKELWIFKFNIALSG